jgi:phage gp45-like
MMGDRMTYDPVARADHIRLLNSVRRVEIVKVYDEGEQQLVDVQGLAGELLRGIARVQHFGESSNPPAGCDGIMISVGASANSGVVIGGDFPDARPKNLPVGCKAIYNQYGDIISLLQHEIRIKTVTTVVDANVVDVKTATLVVEGRTPDENAAIILDLPTSDPAVPGRLWLDVATRNVKVSAG